MTAIHATTDRSLAVTRQHCSRRAPTYRCVLHHRVAMFQSSRPRRFACTRTSASTNPSKTTRVDHVPSTPPAHTTTARPHRFCLSLFSLLLLFRPLCHHCSFVLFTTVPQSTVPSPPCFLGPAQAANPINTGDGCGFDIHSGVHTGVPARDCSVSCNGSAQRRRPRSSSPSSARRGSSRTSRRERTVARGPMAGRLSRRPAQLHAPSPV